MHRLLRCVIRNRVLDNQAETAVFPDVGWTFHITEYRDLHVRTARVVGLGAPTAMVRG
jgi:hypothetical protein